MGKQQKPKTGPRTIRRKINDPPVRDHPASANLLPSSTVGIYKPGVGTTITRANITLANRGNDQAMTALQIAQLFTQTTRFPPEERHLKRARDLLSGLKRSHSGVSASVS